MTTVQSQPNEYPSMFDESRDMLLASILVYVFANLRDFGRQSLLPENDWNIIKSLPLSPQQIMQVVKNNGHLLHKDPQHVDFYVSALDYIESKHMISEHGDERTQQDETVPAVRLVVFQDENHTEEMVYAITVNTVQQRIVVSFRGSVTVKDFLTDARTRLIPMDNPLDASRYPRQAKTIGIHSGFYSYLLGKNKRTQHSKGDQIMNQLQRLLAKYPGYQIYFTGHSLGASLATLMAFVFAANDEDWKPSTVTCVTFGSPKCGNLSFRHAFQELERQGKIRCLRVANTGDSVTMLPDFVSCLCHFPDVTGLSYAAAGIYVVLCPRRLYRHVGTHLKLLPNRRLRISRPPESWYSTCCLSIMLRDVLRKTGRGLCTIARIPYVLFCCWCCKPCTEIMAHHSPNEYLERLDSVKKELEGMSMDEYFGKSYDSRLARLFRLPSSPKQSNGGRGDTDCTNV